METSYFSGTIKTFLSFKVFYLLSQMSVEVILKYTPGTCLRQNFVERNNEARLINQKNIQIKSKKKQNSSLTGKLK